MTAQDEHFLPKEPLDLPKPPLDLPSHAEHGKHEVVKHPQDSHPQVQTLLSWKAPGRPFRKRSKDYFYSIILIAVLVAIVAFLFSQYLLIVVIASLVFLLFTLTIVPPRDHRYKISTEGVTIEDHFYLWQELYDFYFKHREGVDIVHVRTHAFIPGELTLILGDIDRQHVKSVLLRFLPFREVVTKTFMEKAGEWLSRTFPLERTRPT